MSVIGDVLFRWTHIILFPFLSADKEIFLTKFEEILFKNFFLSVIWHALQVNHQHFNMSIDFFIYFYFCNFSVQQGLHTQLGEDQIWGLVFKPLILEITESRRGEETFTNGKIDTLIVSSMLHLTKNVVINTMNIHISVPCPNGIWRFFTLISFLVLLEKTTRRLVSTFHPLDYEADIGETPCFMFLFVFCNSNKYVGLVDSLCRKCLLPPQTILPRAVVTISILNLSDSYYVI